MIPDPAWHHATVIIERPHCCAAGPYRCRTPCSGNVSAQLLPLTEVSGAIWIVGVIG